jgi:hypothetical protein
MTTSDQESSRDVALRLVGLYREVAQAAADMYHLHRSRFSWTPSRQG